MVVDRLEAKLRELESVLVKQFRMLQKLVEVTKSERSGLLTNRAEHILTSVDAKEVVLDQLSLIDDHRRMLVQESALLLNLPGDSASIQDLLPYLNPQSASSIRRLFDGISTLVTQVRDLNYGNQALAASRLDYLQSLQAFLVEASLPDAGYRSPCSAKQPEPPAVSGWEYRV